MQEPELRCHPAGAVDPQDPTVQSCSTKTDHSAPVNPWFSNPHPFAAWVKPMVPSFPCPFRWWGRHPAVPGCACPCVPGAGACAGDLGPWPRYWLGSLAEQMPALGWLKGHTEMIRKAAMLMEFDWKGWYDDHVQLMEIGKAGSIRMVPTRGVQHIPQHQAFPLTVQQWSYSTTDLILVGMIQSRVCWGLTGGRPWEYVHIFVFTVYIIFIGMLHMTHWLHALSNIDHLGQVVYDTDIKQFHTQSQTCPCLLLMISYIQDTTSCNIVMICYCILWWFAIVYDIL